MIKIEMSQSDESGLSSAYIAPLSLFDCQHGVLGEGVCLWEVGVC